MRFFRDKGTCNVRSFGLKVIGSCLFALVSTHSLSQSSDASPNTPYPPKEPDVRFEYYAHLLDELNYRRRLQFLFNNPQSIFDGLAIGYVQTSAGNLTFERRDMVVLGAEPVVASRIYDSNQQSNSGFGPGWRLNLDESIQILDNTLIYTKGNGAKHRFAQDTNGEYSPSHATPLTQALSLSVLGSLVVLENSDGAVHYFRKDEMSDLFVLVQQIAPSGTTTLLKHVDRQLTEVIRDGNPALMLEWSGNRITAIKDSNGRRVTYTYDSLGRLASATDVGDQSWSYDYDRSGRLIAAAHPDGQPYLEVEYDRRGRVIKSTTVRDFEFRYYADTTTVVESDGNRHHFKRNGLGITIGYHNERDLRWDLVLDSINRPIELDKHGEVYRFHYTGSKLTSIEHPDGIHLLHYDEKNDLRMRQASQSVVTNRREYSMTRTAELR